MKKENEVVKNVGKYTEKIAFERKSRTAKEVLLIDAKFHISHDLIVWTPHHF